MSADRGIVYVGSCEFQAMVSPDDGLELVQHAEDMLRHWVEEIGVSRGDVAVVVDRVKGPLGCVHGLEAILPSELTEELWDIVREHELGVGDQIMIARRTASHLPPEADGD